MNLPWYKDGLSFKCTGCGQCCTGSPGYVWVNESEAQAIADALKIDLETFVKKYTRRIGNRLSLKENSKTYDCVFLKDLKCTIYTARPKQCRTFPWWPENLESREAWEEAKSRCEGIEHAEAPLIPLSEIKQSLD